MPGITAQPAWPTLRAHLILTAAHGGNPLTHLSAAAAVREVDTAGDTAAVLGWRLDDTGLRGAGPGPLPWVPAIPTTLREHPTWGAYLTARSELVSSLAIRGRRARTHPGTPPRGRHRAPAAPPTPCWPTSRCGGPRTPSPTPTPAPPDPPSSPKPPSSTNAPSPPGSLGTTPPPWPSGATSSPPPRPTTRGDALHPRPGPTPRRDLPRRPERACPPHRRHHRRDRGPVARRPRRVRDLVADQPPPRPRRRPRRRHRATTSPPPGPTSSPPPSEPAARRAGAGLTVVARPGRRARARPGPR